MKKKVVKRVAMFLAGVTLVLGIGVMPKKSLKPNAPAQTTAVAIMTESTNNQYCGLVEMIIDAVTGAKKHNQQIEEAAKAAKASSQIGSNCSNYYYNVYYSQQAEAAKAAKASSQIGSNCSNYYYNVYYSQQNK